MQILKWLLYLSSIAYLFYSCTTDPHYYKIAKTDSISINLSKEEFLPPYEVKERNDTLFYYSYTKQALYLVNLKSNEKIDSINIRQLEGRQFLQDFYFYNYDSIIIFHSPTFWGDYHENAIQIVDSGLNTKYKACVTPLNVRHRSNNNHLLKTYFFDQKYFRHNFTNSGMCYTGLMHYDDLCEGVYTDKAQLLAEISFEDKDSLETITFKPDCGKFHNIRSGYKEVRGFNSGNRILLALGNSNKVLLVEDNQKKYVRIPFQYLPQITKVDSSYVKFRNYEEAEYEDIIDGNDYIYWVGRIARPKDAELIYNQYPVHEINLLDKNDLHSIGSAILPAGYERPYFIRNGLFYAYNKLKSTRTDKIIFEGFKFEKTDTGFPDLLSFYEKNLIKKEYTFSSFSELLKIKKVEKAVFYDINGACPKCVNEITQFFRKNKVNAGLFLIADNINTYNNYIKHYKLYQNENIFYVSPDEIYRLRKQWTNMLYVDHEEIKLYQSVDMSQLIDRLKY